MKDAYLVTRKERHVDDKHWVCTSLTDALVIARAVAKYWVDQYELSENELDRRMYGDMVFSCAGEDWSDSFLVQVEPIKIREAGETEQSK